ncbi:MAG: ATP-binding protein [Candidatus Eutrophobiaceae bacterium]
MNDEAVEGRRIGDQLERIAIALERTVGISAAHPKQPSYPSLQSAHFFLWRDGRLLPLPNADPIALADLACIESQKEQVERNLAQFTIGRPANHMLLWGAKGTGKSSLLKAAAYGLRGRALRAVEIKKSALGDLPDLIGLLSGQEGYFMLYCDDLGFSSEETDYRALKGALDGSLLELPPNVLFAATSNRRHLVPERISDNSAAGELELHPEEAVDDKISLAERFGLWLAFHAFSQEEYLRIAEAWLHTHGIKMDDDARQAAVRWALLKGSRSGRVAAQFASNWAGGAGLAH